MWTARTPRGQSVVLLHPPKTAGTTLGDFFLHTDRWELLAQESHQPYSAVEGSRPEPDHLLQVFRNPWDRLVSFYQEAERMTRRPETRDFIPWNTEDITRLGFEGVIQQFIDFAFEATRWEPYYESKRGLDDARTRRPPQIRPASSQTSYFPKEREVYLLRFDTLYADWKWYWIQHRTPTPKHLEHHNQGRLELDYASIHTDLTRQIVQELWPEDIRVWNTICTQNSAQPSRWWRLEPSSGEAVSR